MALFECSRFSPYIMPRRLFGQRDFFDERDNFLQRSWLGRSESPFRIIFEGNQSREHCKRKSLKRQCEQTVQPWSETLRLGNRFHPENVTIRTNDDSVMVTAKREQHHEDRLGEGHSMEQMMKTVLLPKNVNPQSVKAFISDDGELKLVAQRRKAIGGAENTSKAATAEAVDCLRSLVKQILNVDGKEIEGVKSAETKPEISDQEAEDGKLCNQKGESVTVIEEKMEQVSENTVNQPDEDIATTKEKNTDSVDKTPYIPEKQPEPWKIVLNMDGFKPENITCKVKGNLVTVTAEIKEEIDGFYSYQHTHRAFTLPKNVDPGQLNTTCSKSGTLHLTAPVVEAIEYTSQERQLPLNCQSGPAVEN